ncbi:MAG TPA: acetyltransferase [Vicinamibacterales bacterium]|nr:acetyltransferase [Vicinamibacterales bacterium]
MHIRRPRPQEGDILLAVWERSVRASHTFLSDSDVRALRPLVAVYLAGDALDLWVLADDANVAVGFLGIAGDAIDALFLDPAYRGLGYGRRLVEYAQAMRPGCPLTVDVNEQNEGACRFYATLGFVVVSRSPLDDAGRPFPLLHMRRGAMAKMIF